ncbi:hypothetical protein H4219_006158, partial [Mycoemilia scoparia]
MSSALMQISQTDCSFGELGSRCTNELKDTTQLSSNISSQHNDLVRTFECLRDLYLRVNEDTLTDDEMGSFKTYKEGLLARYNTLAERQKTFFMRHCKGVKDSVESQTDKDIDEKWFGARVGHLGLVDTFLRCVKVTNVDLLDQLNKMSGQNHPLWDYSSVVETLQDVERALREKDNQTTYVIKTEPLIGNHDEVVIDPVTYMNSEPKING